MEHESSRVKRFTRGGQIAFNNIRMMVQVNQKLLKWSLIITLVLLVFFIYHRATWDSIQATYYYCVSWVFSQIGLSNFIFHMSYHGDPLDITASGVLKEEYFSRQVLTFIKELEINAVIGGGIACVLMFLGTYWLIRKGMKQEESKFVRGSKIKSNEEYTKAVKRSKVGASKIEISGVPMLKDFEVQHTLIHGTTGSGKGQTFNQFIEQIRSRGDSAIIFDKGCVFTSLFYNEKTDVILNPLDERCSYWDLWSEAKSESDFENIAASLIPKHGESDPYWVDAARTVFSAAAFKMRNDKDRSVEKLLSLIMTSKLEVLAKYLEGTEAATLVSDKIEKTAVSIRSVMSTYLKSFRFMKELDHKESFCIKDWVKYAVGDKPYEDKPKSKTKEGSKSNENKKGEPKKEAGKDEAKPEKKSKFLFISSKADHHASLRSLISMWLSMATLTLMSLSESQTRRIWFICDELPSLNQLPHLQGALSEVRKFGGCFVLGMQSFSQLKMIYGPQGASAIFDLLNTRFFFRSPSADVASIVSKELGEEDIEVTSESYSYGANTIRDGISIGMQRVSRSLVTPSEIMDMPSLEAYLRASQKIPITKITLEFQHREQVAPGFVERKKSESDEAQKTESVDVNHLDDEEGSDGSRDPCRESSNEKASEFSDDVKENTSTEDTLSDEESPHSEGNIILAPSDEDESPSATNNAQSVLVASDAGELERVVSDGVNIEPSGSEEIDEGSNDKEPVSKEKSTFEDNEVIVSDKVDKEIKYCM